MIDIIKQNGAKKIMEKLELKNDLIAELIDVLICYNDVCVCYGVSEEDLKHADVQKFEKNMDRW